MAGEYDLRRTLDKALLPESLSGLRCLDVGTHDGFWAFAMEQRGAREVVAIDIESVDDVDFPGPPETHSPTAGGAFEKRKSHFDRAHSELGSAVTHRYKSVYDLDSDQMGLYDFVHVGSLLQHLRDPVGALTAVRRVTHGKLLVTGTFALGKSVLYPRVGVAEVAMSWGQPFWYTPNLAGLATMIEAAGFRVLKRGRPHLQPRTSRQPLSTLRHQGVREWPRLLVHSIGVPHVGVLAEPA